MIDSEIMYAAFAKETNELANSYDIESMPEHRFSLRYRLKKRAMIKAYRRTLDKGKNRDFDVEYRRISLRQRIRLAVLVAVTAMVATGAGLYVTYVIGGIKANQQSTHSDAFAMDLENAPNKLEKTYQITYDLSKFDKEVLCDDTLEYWENYTYSDSYINFIYKTKEEYQNVRLNTEGTVPEKHYINGYEALYFITNDGGQYLVWDNGEYIFELVFNIEYDTAVQIAESIELA